MPPLHTVLSLNFLLPLVGIVLLLACIVFCIHRVIRRSRPRWYWLVLVLLLCGGTLTSLVSAEFAEGPEMPAAFQVGLRLTVLGMIAAVASAILLATKRILARRESAGKIPQ